MALFGSSRKRLWPILLIVVAVLIILFLTQHRTLDVDARYVLGSDRRGIQSLSVKWSGVDNGKVVMADFNYDESVPRVEEHQIEVPTGDYEVTVIVSYADGASRVVEQRVTVEGEGTIELNLASQ